jgi:hypothetical protein
MLEEVLYQDVVEIKHSLPLCFLSDINCFEDVDLTKDEVVDLRTKNLLHLEFNSNSLGDFWCS